MTPPKSIRYARPTFQRSCHFFATRSACSCSWTANPFASTDASRPRRHLLDPAMRHTRTISHRCRRSPVLPSPRLCTRRCHTQSDQPPACRFAAPSAALRGSSSSASTSSTLLAGRAQNANAGRNFSAFCCRQLCHTWPWVLRKDAAQGSDALHQEIPECSFAVRGRPWSTPDQKLMLSRYWHLSPCLCTFPRRQGRAGRGLPFPSCVPVAGQPRAALRASRRPTRIHSA